jgi:hypothetical protein
MEEADRHRFKLCEQHKTSYPIEKPCTPISSGSCNQTINRIVVRKLDESRLELILPVLDEKMCDETQEKIPKIHFISGNPDLTHDEFCLNYAGPILEAALEGDEFVVGDGSGADLMAQRFLKAIDAKVIVYHALSSPMNNEGFPSIGGYLSNGERDTAMTEVSDYDILWVGPRMDNAGITKNLERRKKKTFSGE